MAAVASKQLKRVVHGCRRVYEIATYPSRTLPDYLIIGGQKCGTTSLHHYLNRHPDLAMHRCKEVHYFDAKYDRGERWYRSFFPSVLHRTLHMERTGHPLLAGEATPYYLFHPDVPQRAAGLLPNARLIVLLRNPVDRAYSHYHHNVQRGREPLPFREALAAEPSRVGTQDGARDVDHQNHSYFTYAGRGIYADQLARWLRHFHREQMLILQSEAFFADPASGLAKIVDFLGLRHFENEAESAAGLYNKGIYKSKIDPNIRAELGDYFAPYNERLYEMLQVDWRW